MAHDATSHEGSEKRIWHVFILLTILTTAEVILGIIKPSFLVEHKFLALKLLNWIFIILTIVKAYYITWAFMHMEGETKGLRRAVVWTAVFLISYLMFILLVEGDYIHEVYKAGYIKYNF
ncbi:MAG: cytochrome C oxidase subunit IV [Bacteroidetes bacterium HGW-Bacteroidetes-2]|jgi:cytochrome c oxidase subunit IV|nr:MAG: cytochrome C oxidase subunit IV [Bacteroidetes bacterium HGW-Bacteroidetes-2]